MAGQTSARLAALPCEIASDVEIVLTVGERDMHGLPGARNHFQFCAMRLTHRRSVTPCYVPL